MSSYSHETAPTRFVEPTEFDLPIAGSAKAENSRHGNKDIVVPPVNALILSAIGESTTDLKAPMESYLTRSAHPGRSGIGEDRPRGPQPIVQCRYDHRN